MWGSSSHTARAGCIFLCSLFLFIIPDFAGSQTSKTSKPAPTSQIPQINDAPIGQIVVDGAKRFSRSQIASASGLTVGQTADAAALDAAANRLSETGAFSEVGYRFQTLNGKKTVTFHVVEEPNTMTCAFDNFVWFAPPEIDGAIRAEVPLYDGRVPLDGNLSKAVAAALEHLMATRHIGATVGLMPTGKLGSAPTQFLYSARGNVPVIASVEYLGGPLDASAFSIATERLQGHPFSTAYSRSIAENDLGVIYQNHGYLRATFSDAVPTFSPGTNADDPGKVDVVFNVTPGIQYLWNGADWNGDLAYSATELDRFLGMKPGEVAAADKISTGMETAHTAYEKKGYINAVFTDDRQFNDATQQVHLSLKIKQGDQYHMGTFTVTGASNQISGRIIKAWRLKTGDIYNGSYWKDFGKEDLPNALKDMGNTTIAKRISYSVHPNADSLTVDILLTLE